MTACRYDGPSGWCVVHHPDKVAAHEAELQADFDAMMYVPPDPTYPVAAYDPGGRVPDETRKPPANPWGSVIDDE